MNLALVANDLSDGGAQRVLVLLARKWVEQGHCVTIVTTHVAADAFPIPQGVGRVALDCLTGESRTRAYEAAKGKYEESLEWSRLGADLLEDERFGLCVERLREELARCSAEIVISFGGSANVTSVIACAELPGATVVVRDGNDPRRFTDLHIYNALRRFIFEKADQVVCNTESGRRYAQAVAPGAAVAYIPNPVVERSARPLPWAEPRILTVGRLTPQKDHRTLLAAFAEAPPAPWRLAIVGAGELEAELRERSRSLGIADRVDWHGFASDPFPYYRSARIFALPSRFEGMPNALLEAMSFSLPCVVSDGSEGPAELVRDGETGLVVPAGDPAALARALARLADDPGLRERLGANARRFVDRFAIDEVVFTWNALLGLD